MAYHRDLSTNAYLVEGEGVRAIAWLDAEHPYSTGDVPPDFVSALRAQLEGELWVYLRYRGSHACELCGPFDEGCWSTDNLFVPSPEYLYVAPVMIAHYIEEHRYRPPEEFVRAVEACPPQCSPAFVELLRRYEHLFEPIFAVERSLRPYGYVTPHRW